MNFKIFKPLAGRSGNERKLLASLLLLVQSALIFTVWPSAAVAAEVETDSAKPILSPLPSGPGVRVWPAPNQLAIVCAVHGTTQQSGCFKTLAPYLNAAGFSLVAMDLRAHGVWYHNADQSQPRHRLDYSGSASDLKELARKIRGAYPNTPVYCIGESVGAGVTALAACADPKLFDGIILASPGTTPRFYNPLLVVRDFCKGITNLDRQLDVSGYITRYSSEDARITHEMCTDRLSRTTLSGKEILKTAWFIRKTPQFVGRLSPETHTLILQGADDHIVRLSSISAIMRSIPGSDKKLVVFPECGHILLGTAFLKSRVVNELIGWLTIETSKTPSVVAVRNSVQATPSR